MQEALADAMKFDLEEGNFCDVLLDKITDEDDKKKNNNNSSSPFAHKPMLLGYAQATFEKFIMQVIQ